MPIWMQRLLGIQPRPGEGAQWSLEYAWHSAPWLTLLLALGAVVLVVAIYLREAPETPRRRRLLLAAIRLAALGIVLLMAAQVSLSVKRTGLPFVALIVDDSLSMTTVDQYGDKLEESLGRRVRKLFGDDAPASRWNIARTLMCEDDARFLAGLCDRYKLRVFTLDRLDSSDAGTPAGACRALREMPAAAESTRLGAAVRKALDELRGAAPAAIVLLTDGINTDGPTLAEAAAVARRRGVPLLTIGIGSDKPIRDLKLSEALMDDVVFVNDIVNVEVKITGTGFQGAKVPVVLREEGKDEVLAKTEVTIGPDGQSQQVRLPFRPTAVGRHRYVIEIEPQKGEQQTDNNREVREVEVRKETIRVLLAAARPNYEFRFLRNALGRDETIELKTVLQDADVEYAEQDAAALRVFPIGREEFFAFDAVILDNVNPALLGPSVLQNLADFVDQPGKGGALVLIAGEDYMPLAWANTPLKQLMPFNPSGVRMPDAAEAEGEGFRVEPTDLGLAMPGMQLGDSLQETRAIWQGLPPFYWTIDVGELKPGVRVLAEHPTRVGRDGQKLPVIFLQYVGAGKVLFHATDETYRWRYRTGDLYFMRYWVQTLRSLCRAKLSQRGRAAVLTTDQAEYQRGETVRLRVKFVDERLAPVEDDGVVVLVEQPGRPTQRITLRRTSAGRGSFEGTLSQPPVGSYRAWIASPALENSAAAVDFTVKPPSGEFERTAMDAAALKQAAEVTGGRFYNVENAARLPRDLPPGRQVPIETLPPVPLWNRWPVLLVLFTLLIGEWILRKRGGML